MPGGSISTVPHALPAPASHVPTGQVFQKPLHRRRGGLAVAQRKTDAAAGGYIRFPHRNAVRSPPQDQLGQDAHAEAALRRRYYSLVVQRDKPHARFLTLLQEQACAALAQLGIFFCAQTPTRPSQQRPAQRLKRSCGCKWSKRCFSVTGSRSHFTCLSRPETCRSLRRCSARRRAYCACRSRRRRKRSRCWARRSAPPRCSAPCWTLKIGCTSSSGGTYWPKKRFGCSACITEVYLKVRTNDILRLFLPTVRHMPQIAAV